MLVFHRRTSEYLSIGPDVRVVVKRIQCDAAGRPRVRIAVHAPATIVSMRGENCVPGRELGSVRRFWQGAVGRIPTACRMKPGCYQGQSIQIGNDVRVCIVQIGRRNVLLGVDAPRAVAVLRGEVSAPAAREVPRALIA